MLQITNRTVTRVAAIGLAAALTMVAAMMAASPASAAGSFSVVDEVTGVGGAQTAGRLLRLTPPMLVSPVEAFAEPWPTAPASGLRVRTSGCNSANDPRDLPIKEARPFQFPGGQAIVTYYPSTTDIGYGTCSYRGFVTLTLTQAIGSNTRTATIVIRS